MKKINKYEVRMGFKSYLLRDVNKRYLIVSKNFILKFSIYYCDLVVIKMHRKFAGSQRIPKGND